MSLALSSGTSALAINMTTSFAGTGGTPPYAYSVVAGGAGGSIDPVTGIYTAPTTLGADTVVVTDMMGSTATSVMLVGNPLMLVCDIIQNEMGLAPGRVYLWDQKINEPSDSALYCVVQVLSCKPFGMSTTYDGSGSGFNEVQTVNMMATLSFDIKSRGPDARDRKEEVIMALSSTYAESQQEINGFKIGKISNSFVDLSQADGAAIPYRFNISVNIQYVVTKVNAVGYYNTFSAASVVTNQ